MQLTPILAVLLAHDLLLSRGGVALPQTHGLRAAVERHKARLAAELSRARLRRRCATIEALRALVEAEANGGRLPHPRWVRVNSLRSSVDEQLETTFKGYEVVASVGEVMAGQGKKILCLDGSVPGLLALPPGTDVSKTEAYRSGAIIFQDKASCFPAYLLDPRPEDGTVIDACAAPGNKTTHLAAIIKERSAGQKIHAFEKDKNRAKTLEKMVKIAGSDGFTVIHPGQDFMRVDPHADEYRQVGALLLDPSCSGSGIVGRDEMPELHLPELSSSTSASSQGGKRGRENMGKNDRKRKREESGHINEKPPPMLVDDDGETTVLLSEKDLRARIEALASFQLSIILHAFSFPAASKVTYSTCSIYAGENEHVVLTALASDIAKQRGWKILRRNRQVRGMQEWPVRGDVDACDGDQEIAEACIRTYRDDGRGVMGFFVAGFVREGDIGDVDGEGPFVRDEQGRIVRDEMGIPTLKATGKKAIDPAEMEGENDDDDESVEYYVRPPDGSDGDGDGPYLRDAEGRIVRDAMGMPTLKESLARKGPVTGGDGEGEDESEDESSDDSEDDWSGFDD